MEQPQVDIVLPVYRALEFTKKAVQSVLKFTTWPYHLYIADDASNMAEMDSFYSTLPVETVTIMRASRRRGFGDICNYTVNQVTKANYICLLNSDTEVLPQWLSPMMIRMLSNGKIGIVGAKLIFPPNKPDGLGLTLQHCGVARNAKAQPYHPFRGFPANIPQAAESHEVNAVTGACFLVRRATWQELHGFDRQFEFAQFEDVDFCWRAREKGWLIWYEADATLYHYEHGSGENYVTLRHDANRAKLLSRWGHLHSDEFLFGPDAHL